MTTEQLRIIDRQADFIIAYKPAGVSFHDEQGTGNGFFIQLKQLLNVQELYPVHRLDKITSGLIIVAKTAESARIFQQLFSQHQVEKYYLAISDKKPKKKQGLLKGDMEKSRRGSWKLMKSFKNPAVTQFFSYSLGCGQRLFLLKPHTGKTHQIRVALNSLGAPILGDPIYYKQASSDRGYLHAYALRFLYEQHSFTYQLAPESGELFINENTQKILADIGNPWLQSWPKY